MEGYLKTKIFEGEHAFKFDLKSIGLITKDVGTSWTHLLNEAVNNPYLVLPIMLYRGMQRAAEVDKQVFVLIQEDIYNMLATEPNGVYSDNVMSVFKVFSETSNGLIPKSVTEAIEKAQEGKPVPNGKKSTGKKT